MVEDANYPGYEAAERHARFYADRTRKVTFDTFIDAFTHGYKHGIEDERKNMGISPGWRVFYDKDKRLMHLTDDCGNGLIFVCIDDLPVEVADKLEQRWQDSRKSGNWSTETAAEGPG